MFVARSAPASGLGCTVSRIARIKRTGFGLRPGAVTVRVDLKRASRVASTSRWSARGPTTIVLARSHPTVLFLFSFLDPSLVTFVCFPFRTCDFSFRRAVLNLKKALSLAFPSRLALPAQPRIHLFRARLSLSPSRPSSSPAMIHVFPPKDLSGAMSNLDMSSPIPHNVSCTSVVTISRPRHLRTFPWQTWVAPPSVDLPTLSQSVIRPSLPAVREN